MKYVLSIGFYDSASVMIIQLSGARGPVQILWPAQTGELHCKPHQAMEAKPHPLPETSFH